MKIGTINSISCSMEHKLIGGHAHKDHSFPGLRSK